MCQKDRKPISTRISEKHREMLNQIKTQHGLPITTVIEQGIELIYDQLLSNGLLNPELNCTRNGHC